MNWYSVASRFSFSCGTLVTVGVEFEFEIDRRRKCCKMKSRAVVVWASGTDRNGEW